MVRSNLFFNSGEFFYIGGSRSLSVMILLHIHLDNLLLGNEYMITEHKPMNDISSTSKTPIHKKNLIKIHITLKI